MTETSIKGAELRSQVRGSAILLGGRMIALLLNLVVHILVVGYLVKSDYGAFAYAVSMVALATNVSLFGMDKTLARFMAIYHESKDYRRMAGTVVLVLGTVAGAGLAVMLGIIGFRSLLNDHLISNPLSLVLLVSLIALTPVDGLNAVFQSVFGVFGEVKTVFFRRYVFGPLLKLMAIILVIAVGGDVQMLAYCHLAAGIAGMSLYAVMSYQIFKRENLCSYFRPRNLKIPARELFGFSIPLLSNQVSFLFRTALVVIFLEAYQGTIAVAEFRSVLPFARLNLVVISSFSFLFTPLASRMFSRDENNEINDLYWTSASWVLVLTFPALMLTSVFAEPLTLMVFGERYEGSSLILAVMSIGFFFDAALGFTLQTLRVHAKIKWIVSIDVVALALSIGLFVLWIPKYGANGAAFGAMIVMIFQNLAYFICMKFATGFGSITVKHALTYVASGVIAAVLFAIHYFFEPNLPIAVVLIIVASFVLLVSQRKVLQTSKFFPELIKIPIVGRYLIQELDNPTSPSETSR